MTRKVRVQQYFDNHQLRRLQLGASYRPKEGWLNTDLIPMTADVIYLDATRRFPFTHDVFDYVYCEHMIEHISYTGPSRC